VKSLVRNGSGLLVPALAVGAAYLVYKQYKKSKAVAAEAASSPTTDAPSVATSGIGSYYDVSAAGAPYQGMLGLGGIAPMNTVIPTDAIRRAHNFPWIRPVTRQFANPNIATGNSGGGTFSRNLFTGMTG